MSSTSIFFIGVLVTLILAAAMALLIYAAVLDGRDGREIPPGLPGPDEQNHAVVRLAEVTPPPTPAHQSRPALSTLDRSAG